MLKLGQIIALQWPLNVQLKGRVVLLLCMLSRSSCVQLWDILESSLLGSSVGFSRQEYWSGLPCSHPGNLPNPDPCLWHWQVDFFFTTSATWEASLTSKSKLEMIKLGSHVKSLDRLKASPLVTLRRAVNTKEKLLKDIKSITPVNA